jgi:hypothetical protein
MAQTKRKRRNKHRGNAVGMVEARGRTSKPTSTSSKSGKGSSTQRGLRTPLPPKPPSWQSAAMKAAFGCVILFIFFAFLSDGTTTGQAAGFCAFAFVLYTPIMFYTDRFIYNRKLRQQAAKKT